MIRRLLSVFALAVLILASGCGGTVRPTVNNDDWFRRQNEQFERLHADHVKESSKAVRGYQRYRNRQ